MLPATIYMIPRKWQYSWYWLVPRRNRYTVQILAMVSKLLILHRGRIYGFKIDIGALCCLLTSIKTILQKLINLIGRDPVFSPNTRPQASIMELIWETAGSYIASISSFKPLNISMFHHRFRGRSKGQWDDEYCDLKPKGIICEIPGM